jgi:Ca2+-binding RTX toxin-like protein
MLALDETAGNTGRVGTYIFSVRSGAVSGTAGANDTLEGGAGNDTVNGGVGVDTAIYNGSYLTSTVALTASGYTISGQDGTDTLVSTERIQFPDRNIAIDLGAGQSAGNTVRVIGAAFDAPAIQQHPEWVGIGLQIFDLGTSMSAVCQQVAQIMGLNNTAFVTQVYTNVVGFAPDPASLNAFVGLLQGSGGSMTQGQLLEVAATIDLNATININLTGLQQMGVEFL